jgi:hypothetical protein
MKYTIEPLFAPLWNEQEEMYLPTDELVGFELWDSNGKVVATAETREELMCYVFLNNDDLNQRKKEDLVRG